MVKRSLGIIMIVGLLLVGAMASTAVATEAEVEFQEYEQIVDTAGENGGAFLPEEYSRPAFFDWLLFPLMGIAVLMTGVVLFRYLIAQPRFSREAEERSRR